MGTDSITAAGALPDAEPVVASGRMKAGGSPGNGRLAGVWPDWSSTPLFTDLIYEPQYLNDIRLMARRVIRQLERSTDAGDMLRDIQPLKAALDQYVQARALVDICYQINRGDVYFAEERQRYRRDRKHLNELMGSVYQRILTRSDLLGDMASRLGKMPLLNAHNETAINRDYVMAERSEEDELTADIEAIGRFIAELPMSESFEIPMVQPHGDRLIEMFHELAAVRAALAKDQGFPSFIELGYRRLGYFDFDPEHALDLHRAIEQYIVPIACRLRKWVLHHGGDAGADIFRASVIFPEVWERCRQHRPLEMSESGGWSRPMPESDFRNEPECFNAGAFEACIGTALGPSVPPFWSLLQSRRYVQIFHRPGTRLRNKCFHLPAPRVPVLFCNRELGTDTLGHYLNMAGRAYGYLCSGEQSDPFFYQEPALASVRIWGRAMELLSFDSTDLLFGQAGGGTAWRQRHMANLILELPLLSMVDEFQMQMFAAPEATADDWYLIWRQLIRRYFPDLAADDAWLESQNHAWMSCESTFSEPFSALSRMVASICAVSLWEMAAGNRPRALQAYHRFCSQTHTDTCLRLLKQVGIPDPFDRGTLKRVAYQCCRFFDL